MSESQIERVECNFTRRVASRNNKREDDRYENKDRRKRSKSFDRNTEEDQEIEIVQEEEKV